MGKDKLTKRNTMSKQEIIEQTLHLLAQLPEDKAAEIRDFAAFLVERKKQPLPVIMEPYQATRIPLANRNPQTVQDENTPEDVAEAADEFRADLSAVINHSKAYDFLYDEPDLYTDDDLIERYK